MKVDLWGKLRLKSDKSATGSLQKSFKPTKIDDEYFETLEQELILADMGVALATQLITSLKKQKFDADNPSESLSDAAQKLLSEIIAPHQKTFEITDARPFIIMVAGVNGAGKTTSIAKLAYYLKSLNYSVGLIAGDSFRAGAAEQLEIWAERLNIPCVRGEHNADPAALAFQAIQKAQANSTPDILIMDTAGRLHNNDNLMAELAKIPRVMQKLAPDAPHETLLVLDGTSGQNVLSQLEAFRQVAPPTGLIITKLDSSAKGGTIPMMIETSKLPVYFLGLGETLEDLLPFDADTFLQNLFNINGNLKS